MINGKRVLGLITARAGSKGLPGKNIRPLCGKPLIVWSVEQALSCPYIDGVVVSTDGEDIAAVARRAGAHVPFLRPAELADDAAKSIDVILHAVDHLAGTGSYYDIVTLLEPTSPLREGKDITGALERLATNDDIRSIVSVSEAEASHPSFLFSIESGCLRPVLDSQPNGVRRQDVEGRYYFIEGSIYASTVDALREFKGFHHAYTAAWVVERYKSIEIDELCDAIMAESLMSARLRGELK
ncbi:cytidylyltransferase domain-containing protein [Bradyrhizobium erythrophlei]|uniref:N-acylneuraminate cytidylyltransferase/CMP-N,N'-diacetyllegionaminic acid synthase n=1 Tax=Bradyrhizobium erythrophlei TaxID=1437360 RepID=A0A1M7UHL3_9BRAD|nr:acylneuraminate cytidylyltransferase family protein [Bradyrhizobium erythrophlei]SHN82367.1 N-acylneuraminate cytidylyltransferase/CMP-N,N'-diacetyllegionaminic acid synthase [Bradyrhizobium erythrophlei]